MTFTKEAINKIIGLKGFDGEPINIFDMYGVLYIGNTKESIINGKRKSVWDLDKTFCKLTDHSIYINYKDFVWCETEEDVNEQFVLSLKEIITEKLV